MSVSLRQLAVGFDEYMVPHRNAGFACRSHSRFVVSGWIMYDLGKPQPIACGSGHKSRQLMKRFDYHNVMNTGDWTPLAR